MNSVTPVSLLLPGGVEVELRFTSGAYRRIMEKFGHGNIQEIMLKHSAAALPDVLFALIHDAEGKPQRGLTVIGLSEMIPMDDEPLMEMMAAITSAFTQGRTSKNDIEVLLKKAAASGTSTGSGSEPLLDSASESLAIQSSGGDSSSAN